MHKLRKYKSILITKFRLKMSLLGGVITYKTNGQPLWHQCVQKLLPLIQGYMVLSNLKRKKQVYGAKENKWSNISSLPFDDSEVALSEVPPDSLPAFQAMGWDTGRQGVDIRPHLWDPKEDRFMLVDSGSQCCAWPPDPHCKCFALRESWLYLCFHVTPQCTLKARGSR